MIVDRLSNAVHTVPENAYKLNYICSLINLKVFEMKTETIYLVCSNTKRLPLLKCVVFAVKQSCCKLKIKKFSI